MPSWTKRVSLIWIALIFAASACIQLTLTPGAWAKPEFSARDNTPCSRCHVNPMGGGARNATGFFYSYETALEASTLALKEAYPEFGEFAPVVGDYLQFGADIRAMWHDIGEDKDIEGDEDFQNSTFYLMEAAFYADAKVLPVLHLVGGYDVAQETFEAYGLIDHLPAGFYAKIGRFILPYGVRLDDHTMYTRDGIGFSNVSQDTGVEVGIRPGPYFFSAALTNGLLGDNAQDRDGDYYAITGQTGVRFWKLGLGASFFNNHRAGLDYRAYGPWLNFGIFSKIAYIAEADIFDNEVPFDQRDDPDEEEFDTGWAVTHLLDIQIIRGLNLQGFYTHLDPNWDIKDDHIYKTGGGINFYPIPFFETQFQYRHNWEIAEVDNDEILIQAHFWF